MSARDDEDELLRSVALQNQTSILIARRRAERRNEAYLAEAQRLSRTGSFGWTPSTGVTYWSDETFRIFQYDRTTKPTLELILQRVHPEDAALVRQAIERASQGGKDFDFEFRLVMPDCSVEHVHVIAHALTDESGRMEFVGAVMDVSERKQAEEARERLHQLQAELAHINRVSMLGELAASLSHELKQPITAAITNANTCLRWLKGDRPDRDRPDIERACEAVTRIVRDGNRAIEIINHLRAFYKKDPPLERELVDVNELIREMLVLLRSEATRYAISMHTDLAARVPKVRADRVQLQQVFLNLMLNAIEAMKETGGELTIVSQVERCSELLISVSDTGVGISADKADQIFNAFFTTKPQGSGMGLPISRSIVESHGGRLWATGNSRRGATFLFTLPNKAAAHA